MAAIEPETSAHEDSSAAGELGASSLGDFEGLDSLLLRGLLSALRLGETRWLDEAACSRAWR